MLLDTYEAERLPHVRRAIEFSMELGKVMCVAELTEAARRDRDHGRRDQRAAGTHDPGGTRT